MMQAFRKAKQYVPLYAMIVFAITLLSAIIFVVVKCSASFADFFNYNITAPFRMLISSMTSWIPFSVAELLIVSLPIWLLSLVIIGITRIRNGVKSATKFICFLLSILCVLFITFVWTYSSGYSTTTIDKKLNMEREEVSATELYETALWLADNINEIAPNLLYDNTGASVMNYSYGDMSNKLCSAYNVFSDEYGVVRTFKSKVKPIALSEPFTYTHISGVYSFMTGESNINVNYPDFIVASTSAHELAHQRGIAREEEANFVAFLVCISSDDEYIRYSGYLDVFLNVMNDLYSADKDLYTAVYSTLCDEARGEFNSYSTFFKKYANSKTSEISDSINNSFLQANGQEQGTKSYGMVTDLTVAYYKSKIKV